MIVHSAAKSSEISNQWKENNCWTSLKWEVADENSKLSRLRAQNGIGTTPSCIILLAFVLRVRITLSATPFLCWIR